jgi:hypothetical protein
LMGRPAVSPSCPVGPLRYYRRGWASLFAGGCAPTSFVERSRGAVRWAVFCAVLASVPEAYATARHPAQEHRSTRAPTQVDLRPPKLTNGHGRKKNCIAYVVKSSEAVARLASGRPHGPDRDSDLALCSGGLLREMMGT